MNALQPLELWTKYGRRGRIKEAVGTHGMYSGLGGFKIDTYTARWWFIVLTAALKADMETEAAK